MVPASNGRKSVQGRRHRHIEGRLCKWLNALWLGLDARPGRRRSLKSDKKRKFASIHQIWRSSAADRQRHRIRRVPKRPGNR